MGDEFSGFWETAGGIIRCEVCNYLSSWRAEPIEMDYASTHRLVCKDCGKDNSKPFPVLMTREKFYNKVSPDTLFPK